MGLFIKHRIVISEWESAFGEKVRSPAVQRRVAIFWWVTLTHCESVRQARVYISNVERKSPDKMLRIIGR